MLCTRFDICFAVGLVNRYQSNPRLPDWQVVKRIKHYLHGTAHLVFCHQGGDFKWRGYSNADWDGNPDNSRSTLCYVFTLDGRAMSWWSKKYYTTVPVMEADCVSYCHRDKKHCH